MSGNIIFIPIKEDEDLKIVHWKMDGNALWILTEEPQENRTKGRFNKYRESTQCRARINGEWIDTWLCNIITQKEYWGVIN